jgi:hypothetical protein
VTYPSGYKNRYDYTGLDEHEPDSPLVRRRITRTYQRTAYHLQALRLYLPIFEKWSLQDGAE